MTKAWPEDWPGEALLEGRTRCDLPGATPTEESATRHGAGPAARAHRSVFHNPAMAGCRTRSVLLMDAVVRAGLLGDGRIRALDGLAASGLRARRWLNETSPEVADRIDAVVCDLDPEALAWAVANHDTHPPLGRDEASLVTVEGDLRQRALDGGWQWLDIDPFGSPVPFLDPGVQSAARRAVMEVTATDVAALVGSKRAAGLRRYGARIRLDGLAHDSGLRVLIATIARIAARHDRAVRTLMSIWDSHHLRVSLLVRRSATDANALEQHLGWRIAEPADAEVAASIDAGLHPFGPGTVDAPSQPHALLPLSHPVDRSDKRVSGPLWTGPLADPTILAEMTDQRAEALCAPTEADLDTLADEAGVTEPLHLRVRAVRRAVKGLAEEASLPPHSGLFLTDHIHHHIPVASPPSPIRVVEALREAGHSAAVARYGEPAFRTAAPWPAIITAVIAVGGSR